MEPTRHLAFSERGWLVKTLWQEKELYASYKLRHQVYSDLLGWVPKSKDELEIDSYDSWATSIGIFSGKG